MRMKRIQIIMQSIRLHKESAQLSKDSDSKIKGKILDKKSSKNKKEVASRIHALKGKIDASRKRAKDLWTR